MEFGSSLSWVAVKGEYFICFSLAVASWLVVPCILELHPLWVGDGV